jgi:molecular chaperone GrpE
VKIPIWDKADKNVDKNAEKQADVPPGAAEDAAHQDETLFETTEPSATGADRPGSEKPISEVDQLRSELAETRDRALRAVAELENFRKRTQRESHDTQRYANMSLMRDLLPIVDNLNRAAKAAGAGGDATGLVSGVRMVASQFEDVLARHQCKRIVALGQPFDPNLHEAIAQQPSSEYPAGTVSLEATTGFQLHDRVVRPTQVIVSTGPAT